MKISMILAASAAVLTYASAAQAEQVLNTSLQDVNGSFGAGVATTTTNANGTTTTVAGPGPTPGGPSNRATATPTIGSWYQANVGGGGSVGITKTYTNDGNGAASFATTSGDSKGDLKLNFASAVNLADVTNISYDLFIDSETTNVFAPVMRLAMQKDGAFAGLLVFEYLYQNQTNAPKGQWLNMAASLNSGIFWATRSNLGPTFAAAEGGQKTLAAWIAGNPGSNLTVVGLEIGAGSGWTGAFAGAIDNVTLNGTSFDFAVARVPEPATWAMLIAGFGFVGAASRARRTRVVFA